MSKNTLLLIESCSLFMLQSDISGGLFREGSSTCCRTISPSPLPCRGSLMPGQHGSSDTSPTWLSTCQTSGMYLVRRMLWLTAYLGPLRCSPCPVGRLWLLLQMGWESRGLYRGGGDTRACPVDGGTSTCSRCLPGDPAATCQAGRPRRSDLQQQDLV